MAVFLELFTSDHKRTIIVPIQEPLKLKDTLLKQNIPESDVFITCNGGLVQTSQYLENGNTYRVVPRVLGGKGGFGSMLRAIGAQIEKTTNREACRDLSGRRMRDVNNEQQLRDWVKQKAEREREKEQKRMERAEKRRQALSDPKHKFDDQDYHRQKMRVLEQLEDALTQGLQKVGSGPSAAAGSSTSATESRKRKSNDPGPDTMKKTCDWLGIDIENLSDLDSSSDSDSTNGEPSAFGSDKKSSAPEHTVPDSRSKSSEEDDNAAELDRSFSMDEGAPQLQEHIQHEQPEISSTDKGKGKGKKSGLLQCLSKLPPKPQTPVVECKINGAGQTKASEGVKLPEKAADADSTNKHESVNAEEPVDLQEFLSVSQLEQLGLDRLKNALMVRGLKCGGTLQQRAERLWAVKGKLKEEIDPSLFAKPARNKKK